MSGWWKAEETKRNVPYKWNGFYSILPLLLFSIAFVAHRKKIMYSEGMYIKSTFFPFSLPRSLVTKGWCLHTYYIALIGADEVATNMMLMILNTLSVHRHIRTASTQSMNISAEEWKRYSRSAATAKVDSQKESHTYENACENLSLDSPHKHTGADTSAPSPEMTKTFQFSPLNK